MELKMIATAHSTNVSSHIYNRDAAHTVSVIMYVHIDYKILSLTCSPHHHSTFVSTV